MNIGLIFAGGSGVRMNTKGLPKQFLEMNGKAIIIHTIEHFEKCKAIDAIVIVCLKDYIEYLEDLLDRDRITKVKKIVPGGSCGQESIYHGLCAAEEISENEDDIILIHDGVRPLINADVITNNIQSVKEHGSAITSAVVKETIMVVKDDNSIDYVPDRSHSRVAKAPQSFWLEDILSVHQRAQQEGIFDFIDSCTMMKHYGHNLYLIDGPYENIKITTPDDFYTMRALLDAQENAQIYID